MRTVTNLIIGAGPSGLSLAYHLQDDTFDFGEGRINRRFMPLVPAPEMVSSISEGIHFIRHMQKSTSWWQS